MLLLWIGSVVLVVGVLAFNLARRQRAPSTTAEYVFTGRGNFVSPDVELAAGTYYVYYRSPGNLLHVTLLNPTTNETLEVLNGGNGRAGKSPTFRILEGGRYIFEVRTQPGAKWALEVEPL